MNNLNKGLLKTTDFIKTSFGNIIEWYDFSLYGIFAVSISHAFFPNYSKFISLLMTLVTFSVSFMARPIGSLIFGYLGDKIDRRYSINLSIWCMAIPTVMLGFLPTYNQIGVSAPIILVFIRFIQGVSVGGQLSGLITLTTDNPKHSRSYFIGLILAISMVGGLLASIIGLVFYKVFSLFSAESSTLVWRIPFILSGVLFVIYLKLYPEYEKTEAKANYKLKDIFQQQPYELLYMTLLSAVMGSIYYILFSYSVTFMELHVATSGTQPLIAINLLLFVSFLCFPIYGKLADKSKDRIATAKRLTLILALAILFSSCRNNFSWVISCFTLMVIAYAEVSTYLTGMFAEIFKEEYRMTACSLTYSGGAVIGGLSPSFAEIVAKGSPSGFYMLMLSFAFGLYLLQDKILQTDGYQRFILN